MSNAILEANYSVQVTSNMCIARRQFSAYDDVRRWCIYATVIFTELSRDRRYVCGRGIKKDFSRSRACLEVHRNRTNFASGYFPETRVSLMFEGDGQPPEGCFEGSMLNLLPVRAGILMVHAIRGFALRYLIGGIDHQLYQIHPS